LLLFGVVLRVVLFENRRGNLGSGDGGVAAAILILFGSTLGANTENLHAMSEYAIIAPIIRAPPHKVKGWAVNVVHPTASHAAEVVVAAHVAVETGLGAREFQLSDRSVAGEEVEITVNGSQADFGNPPPDNFVERNRRGVRLELLELLEDHLSLPGTALLRFRFHKISLSLSVIVTEFCGKSSGCPIFFMAALQWRQQLAAAFDEIGHNAVGQAEPFYN
jgi:hypothetical protein